MVLIDLLITHQVIIKEEEGKIKTEGYKRNTNGNKIELNLEKQKEFLTEVVLNKKLGGKNDLAEILKENHTGDALLNSHKELINKKANCIIVSYAIQPEHQDKASYMFVESNTRNEDLTYGLIAKIIATL
ncbi:MAG TPA: hypothetical protein VI790_01975 [Candidatus Nanoarchaeia archaeon]|nr:hypothetical protein [Candidatus Nanoarchaeia archaeon]